MPPESSSDLNTHPSLSFLLPIIPTCTKKLPLLKPVLKKRIQSSSSIMLQKDYWITNDRYWSKCVSESGKQSVRFNPNITEVEYLPETPVKESFNKSSYFDLDSEQENEDDDEEIWKVIIQVGSYLKSVLFTSLFGAKNPNQQIVKTLNRDLVQFCVSAMSFTAWIMYQTFSTVLNHTPFASIQTQNQKKTKTTHLLERKVIV